MQEGAADADAAAGAAAGCSVGLRLCGAAGGSRSEVERLHTKRRGIVKVEPADRSNREDGS